uniref:Uncharacterized protein n=1 Tax=Anguilla anguilla TaxID=7936 RepID=A0A0E9XDT1_ANGAN
MRAGHVAPRVWDGCVVWAPGPEHSVYTRAVCPSRQCLCYFT